MSEANCRFCGSEKLVHISAKTSDMFLAKMPNGSWSGDGGYNFIPGLMEDGSEDYITCRICLACQRVQNDLFEYSDKPKRGKKVWTIREKLEDLFNRASALCGAIDRRAPLFDIVEKLQAVDRCLPGLVRDRETGREDETRTLATFERAVRGIVEDAVNAGAKPDMVNQLLRQLAGSKS